MIMAAVVLASLVLGPAPATPITYVRGGDLYVSTGSVEKRITTGGGFSRPRYAPGGGQLAVIRNGQLWTLKPDGTAARRITTRPATGPSWSPDGKWLAFASTSCTGGPGVYRVAASGVSKPEVLFPRDCRGEDLPDETAPEPVTGALADRLRVDDAVAWSPDGKQIAFRGGECDAVYDACLSIGTIASGAERMVAAYGGGSLQNRGFAVIPSWRPDGTRLAWTAYQEGETAAENEPVHVVELDLTTGRKRTIGVPMDRELTYLDANRALVTAQSTTGSCVTLVDLRTGARTPLHPGSQATAR
ncbi:hypothetical protein Acy02nite_38900 [Actinoplanes cyaneus]|uniref:WD40 repeat protein n=2 Tax=Actinoplanes cyaneus TaxID=52696 RepID=A0A919IHP2_9ACTN|nr:WD40-like Beta Propeller Repeat [Actinoplanes cyaneus]GID66009.1 hypothetical protein Acy02nite_38900 [Actinoplanes cyaneus]